ncbi:autotransporter domain-containing protein [uncultured Phascolarctobacterium sp.]|uniref:autotransporter domain-containing protein n=1 Tax=uncultured Phascolarctobacterium sp. TaxID=512296 RepID=UPI0025F5B0B2|nr:autotransporter domain-containing protein [uncultured Phascolarctobacterium sp.]
MMNKKVLTMAVLAAVCGMAAAPVWAENRGGHLDNGKYVGDNGAANNKLFIDTDFSNDIISGLGTGTDAVKNNSIEMSAGIIRGQLIGGMSEGNGDIDSNSITISGGAVGDKVYGAYTKGNGAVTNNSITITAGTVDRREEMCGAYTEGDGAVTGNSVTISGGQVESEVYGAYSKGNGAVTHNKVIVSGDATKGGETVIGGISYGNGLVAYNSVILESGTMGRDVAGGGSMDGIAEYNSVTVNGGTVGRSVTGGLTDSGIARYNSVVITDGIIEDEVHGADGDTCIENKVLISGGRFDRDIYGVWAMGDADSSSVNNEVIISGTPTFDDPYGIRIYGAFSNDAAVTGNKVTISGAPVFDSTDEASLAGAYSQDSGIVTGNSITINSDLNFTGALKLYGGYSGSGAVRGNKVIISSAPVFAAETKIYGGYSESDVEGNSITIGGDGTFGTTVAIYGGYSDKDFYTGVGGTATGNNVTISGNAAFETDIYGGYSETSTATGNSVTISGRPTFTDDTVIYGGYSNSGGDVSGNILNIKNTDITVPNIKNFDVYNFYLPDTVQAGDVLLTVTGGSGNEQTDLTGSSVNVGIAGSAPAMQSGDNVTLLHNANGVLADDTTVYGKITQGVSLEYDFTTVLENGDSLVTTITRTGISDDTKSLVETQAAAVGFINSGADLLVGNGIKSMSEVASAEDSAIFGAMSGGSMRYDTGSHADVKGYNFALGMGKAVVNNAGKLTFGPFVEYGYGDYTSYLDNGVRGDGKTKYYGVGVLARQDNNSGVYYEGSLRYGRMDADYASNDLGTAGVHSSYDSSSAYYGAHLGIGKVTELNESTKADVYAKLLYTHQNGDSVTLQGEGNGEVYDFDAVDSTRARVGARVSKAYSERGTGYVGLAYEYEFDGEARATVKGFSTPSPSIQGSSGLLELGYILQPKGVNDPTINIGLQGWGGKKQGVTGNVNFVWTF